MKTNRILSAATAVLLAATPTLTMAQGARTAAPFTVAPEVMRTCADVERNPRSAMACAMALQNSIAASSADLMVLTTAARQTDASSTALILRDTLIKHGLTAMQLEGATLSLVGATGDAAARFSIEITCCPLTITIRF